MVHRIQNRNPGYSDFSVAGSAQSFNFSPTMSSPITNGANALKLENEAIEETTTSISSSEMMNQQSVANSEVENVIENNCLNNSEQSFTEEDQSFMNEVEENTSEKEEHVSNGLENFGVEGETAPDLFTSDSESNENEGLLSSENNYEDDDLEIPAFLRRQKH